MQSLATYICFSLIVGSLARIIVFLTKKRNSMRLNESFEAARKKD